MDRPFPADEGPEDAQEHLRAEPRDSMLLMAVMRRPHGPQVPIKIRNLSPSGLMAECPMSFSRGEPVEIEMRGMGDLTGRVAWAAGGRIGIAFDRQIDPRLARKPITAAPQFQLVQASRTMWRPGLK